MPRQSGGSPLQETTLPCGVLSGTCRLPGPILRGAVAVEGARAPRDNVTAHLHHGGGDAGEGAAAADLELIQQLGQDDRRHFQRLNPDNNAHPPEF